MDARPVGNVPLLHSVKLQDGERIVEVSGSALFVRQVLDDLQSLWARLRGEGSPPASIRMPRPPEDPAETDRHRAEAID